MQRFIRRDLLLVLAWALLQESKAWALVHPSALTPRGATATWSGAPQLVWRRPAVGTATQMSLQGKFSPSPRSPALLAGGDPQLEASLELLGRVLTLEDLGGVCAIDAACYGGAGLWSKESYAADISSQSADVVGLFSGSKEGATLVGFGCLSVVLDEGSVTNVAVAPASQGRGIGAAAVCALLALGAARTPPPSYNLEVRASNEAALRLYAAFGFDSVGKRKRYYHNPEEDAVVMTRGPVSCEELRSWRERAESRGLRLQI